MMDIQPDTLSPDLMLEEIEYQRSLNQAITTTTAEALFMLDPAGCVTYVNPAAEEMFGWTQAELAGKRLHDCLHHHYPDGRPFTIEQCPLSRVFQSKHGIRNHEDHFIHKDGSFVQVYCSNIPIVIHGRVTAAVLAVSDITERRRIEQEHLRLYNEAQAALGMRDQFLSVAAHELKNPITTISGYIQLLQRWQDKNEAMAPEQNQRVLRTLANQVQRLQRMIESLLDLSRLKSNQLVIQPAPLDIVALIRRLVDEMQPLFTANRLHVFTPDTPIIIQGDESRLEQVLYNLVQNAIKYGDPGSAVEIHVIREAGTVLIKICDVGIGIAAENLPHLFDLFYRANNVDSLHTPGMGLGLYVVNEIITLHGGTVEVESTPGSGSVFSVRLPLNALVA